MDTPFILPTVNCPAVFIDTSPLTSTAAALSESLPTNIVAEARSPPLIVAA